MNNRVLITYATRAGSTGEVASSIGKALHGRGFRVDVRMIKSSPSVEGYQAILIGSCAGYPYHPGEFEVRAGA